MQRWIGIRASAVLAILGSLASLLFAAIMSWTALRPANTDTPPESPFPIRAVLWIMAVCFAAFGVWGLASAAGIWRRRGWARLSMVIFACLLVGMGGSALVGILFLHIPETPGASPQLVQNIRLGIAAFYGALTVIGTWWLLVFNSAATRQYFTSSPVESARPLSISLIGWYLIVGAVGTAVAATLRMPGMFFGLIFTGWISIPVYTAFTAVQIYLGTGLLQLQEPARLGSIGYFAFLILNSVLSSVLPGVAGRMQAIQRAVPDLMSAARAPVDFSGTAGLMVMGGLLMVVPIWFLVVRRAAFAK